MSEPTCAPLREAVDLIEAAISYIKLRDSLNQHSSPEGKRLNAAVKAYLQAVQSH